MSGICFEWENFRRKKQGQRIKFCVRFEIRDFHVILQQIIGGSFDCVDFRPVIPALRQSEIHTKNRPIIKNMFYNIANNIC